MSAPFSYIFFVTHSFPTELIQDYSAWLKISQNT
jgi:hypothetical protein